MALDPNFDANMDSIADSVGNAVPKFCRELGASYLDKCRKRYWAEGDGWPDLAPSTVARKKRQGKAPEIMQENRDLVQALQIGAPGNLLEQTSDGAVCGFSADTHPGSGKPYRELAAIHAHALPHPANLPQRTILATPDEAEYSAMVSEAFSFLSFREATT